MGLLDLFASSAPEVIYRFSISWIACFGKAFSEPLSPLGILYFEARRLNSADSPNAFLVSVLV